MTLVDTLEVLDQQHGQPNDTLLAPSLGAKDYQDATKL